MNPACARAGAVLDLHRVVERAVQNHALELAHVRCRANAGPVVAAVVLVGQGDFPFEDDRRLLDGALTALPTRGVGTWHRAGVAVHRVTGPL